MQARALLDQLIALQGMSYAQLSAMLGRNPAYVQQYIKRGSPRSLSRGEEHLLALHFEVPEDFLRGADTVAGYGKAILALVKIRGAQSACEELGAHNAASHLDHALNLIRDEVAVRST